MVKIEDIKPVEYDSNFRRDDLKLSQAQLAKKLRTRPNTVATWDQGLRKPSNQANIVMGLIRDKIIS